MVLGSDYKPDASWSSVAVKAWKIIRNVEKAMGKEAVIRVHGGTEGGSATLSDACRTLLKQYMEFERKCRVAEQKVFEEVFG